MPNKREKLRRTLDFLSRYLTILLLMAVLTIILGFAESDPQLAVGGGLGAIALVVVIWWMATPLKALDDGPAQPTSSHSRPGLWWFLGPLIAAVALLATVEASMEPEGAPWNVLRIAVSVAAVLAIGSALLAARRQR